ncbi:TIGR01777 family oxidoreductase [Tepidibacillus decaturensis]|uniref:Epimerase n=1 Tax=Tepidibacillus decaturensis TaxID=1413211 RepID=A0A135L472_9BACI|nr:TIGR01777 family oxidoreductase [Tepidibacillus decaturensis]KXG43730.1 epimerase [Tepidibacillus decaturensis]
MNILIVGGTGFVGKELIKSLLKDGHHVSVITRNIAKARTLLGKQVKLLQWESIIAANSSLLKTYQIDYIINLAGESIGSGRWTQKRKEEIIKSRTETTRAMVDFIEKLQVKPKGLINASAVGYYGAHEDEEITEDHGVGQDFLAKVSNAWEKEAIRAKEFGVRVVILRIGVVLGNGGALEKMGLPFRFYIGGPIGKGDHWLSWIHLSDLIKAVQFLLKNDTIDGPINTTAPNPVRMRDFYRYLAKAMNKPYWMYTPALFLRLALGEMSDMVLKGQKVLPKRLLDSGFQFQFASVESALIDIMKTNIMSKQR